MLRCRSPLIGGVVRKWEKASNTLHRKETEVVITCKAWKALVEEREMKYRQLETIGSHGVECNTGILLFESCGNVGGKSFYTTDTCFGSVHDSCILIADGIRIFKGTLQ
jgi:hypothetical protein